jgi:hypothetical protein
MDVPRNRTINTNPLLINAEVFLIADKYNIRHFKELAILKYEKALRDYWNSPPFVARLRLLRGMTSESSCGLRSIAVKAAGEHVESLMDCGKFATLCNHDGQIAFDVLKASLAREPLVPTRNVCPFCFDELPTPPPVGRILCQNCYRLVSVSMQRENTLGRDE